MDIITEKDRQIAEHKEKNGELEQEAAEEPTAFGDAKMKGDSYYEWKGTKLDKKGKSKIISCDIDINF